MGQRCVISAISACGGEIIETRSHLSPPALLRKFPPRQISWMVLLKDTPPATARSHRPEYVVRHTTRECVCRARADVTRPLVSEVAAQGRTLSSASSLACESAIEV